MRYRSEEEWLGAVEARAREIWDAREQRLWGDDPKWRHVKQPWSQGSTIAQRLALAMAEDELRKNNSAGLLAKG